LIICFAVIIELDVDVVCHDVNALTPLPSDIPTTSTRKYVRKPTISAVLDIADGLETTRKKSIKNLQ